MRAPSGRSIIVSHGPRSPAADRPAVGGSCPTPYGGSRPPPRGSTGTLKPARRSRANDSMAAVSGDVPGRPTIAATGTAPHVGIRAPDHGRVDDVGMRQQDRLDLRRGDVLAARDDEVVASVEDGQPAAVVQCPEVTGVEPAVVKRRGRRAGIPVVAREHGGTGYRHDAHGPGRHLSAALIDHPHTRAGQRSAGAAGITLRVGGRQRGDPGACLGQPVRGHDRQARCDRAPDQLDADRSAAQEQRPQRRSPDRAVVQQPRELGRHQ